MNSKTRWGSPGSEATFGDTPPCTSALMHNLIHKLMNITICNEYLPKSENPQVLGTSQGIYAAIYINLCWPFGISSFEFRKIFGRPGYLLGLYLLFYYIQTLRANPIMGILP